MSALSPEMSPEAKKRVLREIGERMGRPSQFTPEIGEYICLRTAEGAGLNTIAMELGHGYYTLANWLMDSRNEEFHTKFTRAKSAQADYLAEDTLNIVDDETKSTESRRIRAEARRWYASKLKPKKYGDKTILSNDSDNPITLLAVRLDQAIAKRESLIDVTPKAEAIDYQPVIDNDLGSDLV